MCLVINLLFFPFVEKIKCSIKMKFFNLKMCVCFKNSFSPSLPVLSLFFSKTKHKLDRIENSLSKVVHAVCHSCFAL